MKKKLSYRDKLVELAYIYDVKEIKDYERSRKSLTSGQLELILRKNKITIPKDFKSNFVNLDFEEISPWPSVRFADLVRSLNKSENANPSVQIELFSTSGFLSVSFSWILW